MKLDLQKLYNKYLEFCKNTLVFTKFKPNADCVVWELQNAAVPSVWNVSLNAAPVTIIPPLIWYLLLMKAQCSSTRDYRIPQVITILSKLLAIAKIHAFKRAVQVALNDEENKKCKEIV